jgi:hypothetical protein
MSLREDALAAIDDERDDWERLVVDVGEARMTQSIGDGEWSFKDVAAHINGWRSYSLNRLNAEIRGEPTPAPAWPEHFTTDDEINDWIYQAEREKFASEVLKDSAANFVRLHELVAMVSEEDLADPARFPTLEGSALGPSLIDRSYFGHLHDEHEPDIRAWLSQETA